MSDKQPHEGQIEKTIEDSFPASDVPKDHHHAGVKLDIEALAAAPAVSATVRRMLIAGLGAVHQTQMQTSELLHTLGQCGTALASFCQSYTEISEAQSKRVHSALTHFGAARPAGDDDELASPRAIAAVSQETEDGPVRDLAAGFALLATVKRVASSYESLELLARRVGAAEVLTTLQESVVEERAAAEQLAQLIDERLLPKAAETLNAELPASLVQKAFG